MPLIEWRPCGDDAGWRLFLDGRATCLSVARDPRDTGRHRHRRWQLHAAGRRLRFRTRETAQAKALLALAGRGGVSC